MRSEVHKGIRAANRAAKVSKALPKTRAPRPGERLAAKHAPSVHVRRGLFDKIESENKKLFVLAYLRTSNHKTAALEIGFGEKRAAESGRAMMQDPEVAGLLMACQEEIAKRLEISASRVIAELHALAHSNMADYTVLNARGQRVIDLSAVSYAQMAAIKSMTTKTTQKGKGKIQVTETRIELHDKRASLVDLGRYLNIFEQADPEELQRIAFTFKIGGPPRVGEVIEAGASVRVHPAVDVPATIEGHILPDRS